MSNRTIKENTAYVMSIPDYRHTNVHNFLAKPNPVQPQYNNCFKKLGSAINSSGGGGNEFGGAKSSELILNKTNE